MPDPQQIQVPSGMVVCTTYGMLTQQTAMCLLEARSFSEKNGLTNVKWMAMPGTLVEKARNESVRVMLREGCGFLIFVDGDCTFEPNAILSLIQSAYGEMPNADAMGGWCPLRGDLALPTIDSGSGTWESHFPGSGIIPVMRTGGAFLLVKRHVFEAIKDPWFRMRVPSRAVDDFTGVDNWMRIKFNGTNPFREQMPDIWDKAFKCALEDPSIVVDNFVPVEVGEDSGFCDRAKLAGFNLFVNTNIACGHVDQRVLTWQDHRKAMDDAMKWQRLASGLLA